jgi:hypothetical protein
MIQELKAGNLISKNCRCLNGNQTSVFNEIQDVHSSQAKNKKESAITLAKGM